MNSWHPLPSGILSFVEQTPGSVLLHSSRPGGSGISQLFAAPLQVIEVRDLAGLPHLFSKIEDSTASGLFAAGYFSYECAQYFEPAAVLKPLRYPRLLAWFGIYDSRYTFNHRVGSFDSDPPLPSQIQPEREAANRLQGDPLASALNEQRFAERIQQIHQYIRAGDVYQLNFTFPLRTAFAETPASLYQRLSAAQPVEYGAFLHCKPRRHILSFSPELFFHLDSKRHITTQPMKGTARRGRTTAEDRDIAAWLPSDPKNRAENVMIVDLIRNDLGRICDFGSVCVENLFAVSRYPSLWQMTSRISGQLRQNVGYQDIFRALFPCGSITGAPKVRAMQLLAQIEDEPRGIYTGAIGYFAREQTAFNVAIRTLELENGTGSMGVGAGIVIDSDPVAEYRECHLKSEFLTQPSEPFSLIETMLWNGTFPLLDLHLDRLEDSAFYFDFNCDRAAIRETVLAESAKFSGIRLRKVRLLLHTDGKIQIEATLLTDVSHSREPLRVCIAHERTDPRDRFLFHKTTHRQLYNHIYAAALSKGFAEALFLNTRGEITEGAADNILIEKAGCWYTPPLDCGVLPGVYRRYLLSSRSDMEEKILTLDDLKAADGVYICNAVRGLRPVTIEFYSTI